MSDDSTEKAESLSEDDRIDFHSDCVESEGIIPVLHYFTESNGGAKIPFKDLPPHDPYPPQMLNKYSENRPHQFRYSVDNRALETSKEEKRDEGISSIREQLHQFLLDRSYSLNFMDKCRIEFTNPGHPSDAIVDIFWPIRDGAPYFQALYGHSYNSIELILNGYSLKFIEHIDPSFVKDYTISALVDVQTDIVAFKDALNTRLGDIASVVDVWKLYKEDENNVNSCQWTGELRILVTLNGNSRGRNPSSEQFCEVYLPQSILFKNEFIGLNHLYTVPWDKMMRRREIDKIRHPRRSSDQGPPILTICLAIFVMYKVLSWSRKANP